MIEFYEWIADPIDILLSEEHDPYELLGIPQNASYDEALPAFKMKLRTFFHEPSKMVAVNNLMDRLKHEKNKLNAPKTATATRNPYRPTVAPYESPTKDVNDHIQDKVWNSPFLKGWSNKALSAAQSLANMYKDLITSKKHLPRPEVMLKVEKFMMSMAKNGEDRTMKLANKVGHYEDLGKWIKSQKEKAKTTMNIGDIVKQKENRPLGESFTTFKEWLTNR